MLIQSLISSNKFCELVRSSYWENCCHKLYSKAVNKALNDDEEDTNASFAVVKFWRFSWAVWLGGFGWNQKTSKSTRRCRCPNLPHFWQSSFKIKNKTWTELAVKYLWLHNIPSVVGCSIRGCLAARHSPGSSSSTKRWKFLSQNRAKQDVSRASHDVLRDLLSEELRDKPRPPPPLFADEYPPDWLNWDCPSGMSVRVVPPIT